MKQAGPSQRTLRTQDLHRLCDDINTVKQTCELTKYNPLEGYSGHHLFSLLLLFTRYQFEGSYSTLQEIVDFLFLQMCIWCTEVALHYKRKKHLRVTQGHGQSLYI